MRKASLRLLLTATVCCAMLTGASAQESRATLHGQVTDAQRAVIAGARASIVSEDTRVRQNTTTNGQGSWSVPFLNPGNYTVTVSVPGFKVAEQRGIVLQTADIKQIDHRLNLAPTPAP